MRVFLSHDMSGLTRKQVCSIREDAIAYLKSHGYNIDHVIDNYHHLDVPEDVGRLWHLGTSIRMLECADAVYFCEPYTNSNGCLIERAICQLYGLRVLNDELK